MDATELLDDCGLFLNAILEALFKFVQLALFLIKILDQTSPSLLHLVQTTLQSDTIGGLVPLAMLDLVVGHRVLRVPHIVRYEFFDLNFPIGLQIGVADIFDFIHEALDVLN